MGLSERVVHLMKWYSGRARAARAERFNQWFRPTNSDRILDLGSEDGAHFASVHPFRVNVTIADIDEKALKRGAEQFGFQTVLLDESGRLPFADHEFDIVHCSSVIEHVTLPKGELLTVSETREFRRLSLERQAQFASEVARVGRRYYVQTPNRYFWVESHTWLPGVVALLPRRSLIWLTSTLGKWWPKTTSPDWNLLTEKEMTKLFPQAEIFKEKSLGLTKSLMAVRR